LGELSVASALRVGAAQVCARDSVLVGHEGRVTVRSGERERVARHAMHGALLAVASGVGEGADVASASAVRSVGRLASTDVPRRPDRVLSRYLLAAHEALHQSALDRGQHLAASLCAIWAVDGKLGWLHVGDTCIVRLQRGRVARLTTEHTAAEFGHRRGRPVGSAPLDVVQRFIAGSIGLGDDASLHLQQGLDFGLEPLEPADCYLLTTHAVAHALDDAALGEVMSTGDAEEVATRCVRRAGHVHPEEAATAAVLIVGERSG